MTAKRLGLSRRNVLKKGAVVSGALILGGTAAAGTAVADTGDGRVGHYHLNNLHLNKTTNEKQWNHVHDASPIKNHATNEGGELVKDAGRVGNAFEFKAVDDRVLIPYHSSLSGMENLTVSIWTKLTEYTKDGVVIGGGTGTETGLYELVVDDGSRGDAGQLWWAIDNGRDWVINWTDITVETGAWVHLAMVSDFADDEIRVYKNGVEEYSTDGNGAVEDHEQPVGIGARGDGWSGIKGMADEARIYDRALTGDEIAELASMGGGS